MWIPTLAAIAYYTVAGYAGILLLRRGPLADAWGLGALIPQVLQLQLGSTVYKIVCGLQMTVEIDSAGVGFHGGVGSVVEVGVIGDHASNEGSPQPIRRGTGVVPIRSAEPPDTRLKLAAPAVTRCGFREGVQCATLSFVSLLIRRRSLSAFR